MPIKNNDLSFLIACCQNNPSKNNTAFILTYINKPYFDINNLINLAKQHGVLPVVYKALKNLETNTELPNDLLIDLKSSYTQIAQTNILMSAELIRIMKLLKKNNIEALSFKGPTLSQMSYGDITLRQFGDLDILIKNEDRSKIVSLLLQEQYIPEIDLKKETEEMFFECVNVIGFQNPKTGVRTEIHWELLSKNYAINWEEKSLWNKQDTAYINKTSVPTLHFEQLLLYLCVHGSKHLFERLEWICDIDRCLRANPHIDWNYILKEAEKLGIRRMLFLGLALSQKFLQLELPMIITEKIVQDKELPKLISSVIATNFSETSQKEKDHSAFGLLWKMRENISDKLRFAIYALFAPKFDDFEFIQLSKYLAFLYPIVRPFRLITKYFNR